MCIPCLNGINLLVDTLCGLVAKGRPPSLGPRDDEDDTVRYSLVEKKMEEGKIVTSAPIAAHSPWFSGHFPDDPILPGIAQLKMVADLVVSSTQGAVRMTGVSRVKFRKIVRPEEVLDIHVTCGNKADQYKFKITSGGEDVCSGWMHFSQDKK